MWGDLLVVVNARVDHVPVVVRLGLRSGRSSDPLASRFFCRDALRKPAVQGLVDDLCAQVCSFPGGWARRREQSPSASTRGWFLRRLVLPSLLARSNSSYPRPRGCKCVRIVFGRGVLLATLHPAAGRGCCSGYCCGGWRQCEVVVRGSGPVAMRMPAGSWCFLMRGGTTPLRSSVGPRRSFVLVLGRTGSFGWTAAWPPLRGIVKLATPTLCGPWSESLLVAAVAAGVPPS